MSKLLILPPLLAFGILLVVLSNNGLKAGSATTNLKSKHDPASQEVSIAPGELPGYTGWGRPAHTLAGFIEGNVPDVAYAGKPLSFNIACRNHALCREGEVYFFVRAYGPAILTGTVSKQNQGKYRVEMFPLDPGVYIVEVIVTFSNAPDLDSFPLKESSSQPMYEGYMIASYPQQVTVIGNTAAKATPPCGLTDLVETKRRTHLMQGRWKPVKSNRNQHDSTATTNGNVVTLQGYQSSRNSLGILMDYQYEQCQLPSLDRLKLSRPHQFVLIGDSTMRIQKDELEQWVEQSGINHEIVFVELYGGMWRSRKFGPSVTNILQQLRLSTTAAENRVLIANSGLHDIHRLCDKAWSVDRRSYLTLSQSEIPCTQLYRLALEEMLHVIEDTPAAVKLYQTTTAGWPKYGNWGIRWDPRYGQTMPLDATSFVARFNEIAKEVIGNKIPIVDAYWISLARPDNREIDERGKIGAKLSHPGREVVASMVRIWMAAAIDQLATKL